MRPKKITIDDIARATGFSRATVSVALSDRVDLRIAGDTRETVRALAAKLGYTFASSGRASRAGRTALLFLYEDIGSSHVGTSFFVRVAEELKRIGSERGFIVLEASAAGMDSISLRRLIADFKIAACIVYADVAAKAARAAAPSLPLLFLQADGREEMEVAASYLVDDIAIGNVAAQTLLDSGKRNAFMIFPHNLDHRCQKERIEGFKSVFQKAGGRCSLIALSSFDGQGVALEIETALERLGAGGESLAGFDAAYFFSDALALIGLRVFAKAGFRIPEDIAVIGTDNLYWGAFSKPSLSTMELHEHLFAEKIADDVAAALQGRAWHGFATRIPIAAIMREST
ncbi:LacI family DNA-binding transcriptional regulator [Treponema sp.]